ncbi:MAG: tRNA-dihydrouridine synthase [Candidatus Nomurabacteria bacterium]|nr:MAG: tRNA-dihydrouridine synthase [Candidatus Nomurabacteria bacterium]
MANVTDPAFREIIAKYSRKGESGGGPDVFWTEFTSADGLVSEGRENLLIDLSFGEVERPIVAQLFSSRPEFMRKAAKICQDLGFDGIDINMGCPDKAIEKSGSGAAMIKDFEIAKSVVMAAREGAPNIPISVKTRVGYNKVEIDTWIKNLLELDLPALTVHARTRKEMSKVPADWSRIKQIVKLRDKMGKDTLIIGNGDAISLSDAEEKIKLSGCDGVMIGRAMFGNPWIFDSNRNIKKKGRYTTIPFQSLLPRSWVRKIQGEDKYTISSVSDEERLTVLVEHSKLFEQKLTKVKSFDHMKKHFKAYTSGMNGAKELRIKLMECQNSQDVESVVKDYIETLHLGTTVL